MNFDWNVATWVPGGPGDHERMSKGGRCVVGLCKDTFDGFSRLKSATGKPNTDLELTLNDLTVPPANWDPLWVPLVRLEHCENALVRLCNQLRYISFLGLSSIVVELENVEDAKDMAKMLEKSFPQLTAAIVWDLRDSSMTLQRWTLQAPVFQHRFSLFLQFGNAHVDDLHAWAYQNVEYVHMVEPVADIPVSFLQALGQIRCLTPPTLVFSVDFPSGHIETVVETLKNQGPSLDEISLSVRNLLGKAGVGPQMAQDPAFVLQRPLEPATTFLPNSIYESFETDTLKYDRYASAFVCALSKLKTLGEPLSLLCVGPGRGPLLDRLVEVLEMLEMDLSTLTIYAVEQNTAVMPLLEWKNATHWKSSVKLYNTDARSWNPCDAPWGECTVSVKKPVQFHLIFSEIIGSFGCNELMPEVLAPLAPLAHPDCIWIPSALECHVAPVHCPTLWTMASTTDTSLSVPLVPSFLLLSPPTKVWDFTYSGSRDQSCSRKFHCRLSLSPQALHGFVGLFKATLYAGIHLDNFPHIPESWSAPQSKSFSWLPLYIHSEKVIQAENVEITFERDSTASDVTYTWSVVPLEVPNSRATRTITCEGPISPAASPAGSFHFFMY